jgi:hypothetical protein
MSSTSASIQIPAGPDRVWQLIGGFDSAPDWLTFILSSVVSDGGRVRTLTTKDGGVLLERLQAFDESRRTLTYSVDESPPGDQLRLDVAGDRDPRPAGCRSR